MTEFDQHPGVNSEAQLSETQLIPLSEIEINPERHNVLYGLMEIRDEGRDTGKFLVQQFLGGKRVIITGEPATGKSGLFFQLLSSAQENAQRLGIPFEKSVGQYDFVLEMERRLRKKNGQEGKLEDDSFNDRLYGEMMKSDIFEVPAVGSKELVDRGRSAVEKVERNIASGQDNKSLLVSLYSSPLVQTQGESVRAAVASAPAKKVFKLLDTYGMDIEGVRRSLQNANYIKDIFRLMANREHIATIRREVIEEITDWHLQMQLDMLRNDTSVTPPDIIREKSAGIQLVPATADDFRNLYQKFGIESSDQSEMVFGKRAEESIEQMMDQAVYMEWRYRELLGIGSDRALIVGNTYKDIKTVYDLKPLIRASTTS